MSKSPLSSILKAIGLFIFSALAYSQNVFVKNIDFVDAVSVESDKQIVFVNHLGEIGRLNIDGNEAQAEVSLDMDNQDFTAVAYHDDHIYVGTSKGAVYLLNSNVDKVIKVAQVSEYQEPVMGIQVCGNDVWVFGSRGLLAKTSDGLSYEMVDIGLIEQTSLPLPSSNVGTWHFGAANIEEESIRLNGYVNGKPAIQDEDYSVLSEEGLIEIITPFDVEPVPNISFMFRAGPPFRHGDVTWNTMLCEDNNMVIAGEFGFILQSDDNAKSWVRRNAALSDKEPTPAYWLSGDIRGDKLVLSAAAGIMSVSHDGGISWRRQKSPTNEGIFGVKLVTSENVPAIAGAVGTAAVLNKEGWDIADRSQLNLLSWLKTFVQLEEDHWLVLGGRSTVLRYKAGQWSRVMVNVKEGDNEE